MAHLSVVATSRGLDPPASLTVPDVNLTTLGTLDWFQLGESAVGDQNFKAGATYITSVANIGTPASARYASSTDKQASLTSYTDGVSPASGGNRVWIGTSVVGAGYRIVIALGGQSVKFVLGSGGYDGTHRIACTLSDTSAANVSSDQVTGATTVGWWSTEILADATSDAATLTIDVTHISGSGNACQIQHGYLTLGTRVIRSVSPVSPAPGDVVTIKTGGYAAVPLTANSTFAGIGITLASVTVLTCQFTMPARSAFRFGGTHAAKRFYTNLDLVIANAAESVTKVDVQISANQPGGFAARNAVAQTATPLGDIIDLLTWNAGAIVLATADEVWGHITTGSGLVNAQEVNYETYSDPMVIEWTYYDISAGSWSGLTTTTYTETPSLTSADVTLTPGQTVRLTLTGGPFASAITAAYIDYGAYSIAVAWTVISASLTDITAPAQVDYVGGGTAERLRWGANFTLRIVAGAETASTPNTNQIVAPTPGNFSAVVAGSWAYPPTGAQELDEAYGVLTSGTGTLVPSTFGFTPTSSTWNLTYYTYDVSGEIWLASVTGGPLVTLTSETVRPSDTVTITKVAGDFVGTPTATFNGVSIALSGTSGATTTLTGPALTTFLAAATHVATRWAVGYSLQVTDDSGTYPGLLQIVAPIPAAFGLAGAGPYSMTLPSLAQNDDVYLRLVSGTVTTYTPASVTWVTTYTASVGARFYDVSAAQWSAEVTNNHYYANFRGRSIPAAIQ